MERSDGRARSCILATGTSEQGGATAIHVWRETDSTDRTSTESLAHVVAVLREPHNTSSPQHELLEGSDVGPGRALNPTSSQSNTSVPSETSHQDSWFGSAHTSPQARRHLMIGTYLRKDWLSCC